MLPNVSQTTSFIYGHFLKPILFRIDPELVHETLVNTGELLGKYTRASSLIEKVYAYHHSSLTQTISSISFSNPIGLSAGFDYHAKLTQILPSIGFGFMTVGSITAKPYEGNPKPRLGRLPLSKSLMVNKGLKNVGTPKIIAKLASLQFQFPVGFSVARTNSSQVVEEKKGIADYVESFIELEREGIASFYELNISCPNAFGGEPFTNAIKLNHLLREIEKLKLTKPLFIKMPIDLPITEVDVLSEVADKYNVQGLIFGNLTKDRNNPLLHPSERFKYKVGNFSGKPTWERSNRLLAQTYQKYRKRFILIGCGGVFSAQDAYTKIKLGASLVQLITGMVYQGPSLIGQINRGLVTLLQADGYTHISQVVGTESKVI